VIAIAFTAAWYFLVDISNDSYFSIHEGCTVEHFDIDGEPKPITDHELTPGLHLVTAVVQGKKLQKVVEAGGDLYVFIHCKPPKIEVSH